jgi:ribulose-phosphate 3-epimerase
MSSNIRTVPAILTDSTETLEKLVRQAETFTNYAQMDIMDGRFVPSKSISCADIAALKTSLTWEAHLMVINPETCIEDFRQAGAKKIVFHYKATPEPQKIITMVSELGMQVGLAVNPEVAVADFAPLVEGLDSVLFLAVNPGFYGAKFIPEVLYKIRDFRKQFPGVETGIDGGVKEYNIAEIARTGVDVIYIGSAIFQQGDPAESYRRLTEIAIANDVR